MARKNISTYSFKPKKKRPGIHSKNRNTNQKNGKYYTGTKYKGQGRQIMETLKHLLGLCGESHPNLFTYLAIIILFRLFFLYLKKFKTQQQ